LFGELGFDATTTRDIADRSGINKALIHYHFGTKDELLEALLEGYYARLAATMQAALSGAARPSARGSPAAQVEALLDAYADFLAANHSFTRIVQREIASGRHVERVVERTLPMFRLGIDWMGSTFKKPPKDLDAVNLLVTAYGMVVTWFTWAEVLKRLTGKDPLSDAALAARKRHVRVVLDFLLEQLDVKGAH
jgi:AcrR family transcriptional regulator